MFIDIHVHPNFFEPICKNDDKLDIRHQSIGIFRNNKASISHIENQMRCAGLNKLCLLGQDERSLTGQIAVSNEEISTLVKLKPDLFIGFASIDPFVDSAVEELEHAFSGLKLSGLKLNPSKQHYYPSDNRLKQIYELCIKHNKPIMFHSGLSWEKGTLAKFSRPVEFEEIAYTYPDLRFCLAHFGWPWVRETAMLMVKYPNVYTDTSLLYFDSADEFYKRTFIHDLSLTWIERSLRHQIMFGSNNPRFEQIRMAQALGELGLSDDTVKLIKGGNAVDFIYGANRDDI